VVRHVKLARSWQLDLKRRDEILLQPKLNTLVNLLRRSLAAASDVFIRDCVDCTFTIACKQLRVRDCSHCKVYLYSMTRPALETSHHMEFGVFNGAYPRQGRHFKIAGLDPEFNKWDQVHDFNRSDNELPKPHWSKMPDQQWEPWEIMLPDCNLKPANPVPRKSNALWFTQSNVNPLGAKKPGGLSKAGKGLFGKRM